MHIERYSDYTIIAEPTKETLEETVNEWLKTRCLEDNWIPFGGISFINGEYAQTLVSPIYSEDDYKQVYEKSPDFNNLNDLTIWLNDLLKQGARPDLFLKSSNPFEHKKYRIYQILETQIIQTHDSFCAVVRLELQEKQKNFARTGEKGE